MTLLIECPECGAARCEENGSKVHSWTHESCDRCEADRESANRIEREARKAVSA